MRPTWIYVLMAMSTIVASTSAAAIKPKAREQKNNYYPWYYWNNDGQQQGQYPPYMYCGAEGTGSLNMLTLSLVGVTALVFTGMPFSQQPQ